MFFFFLLENKKQHGGKGGGDGNNIKEKKVLPASTKNKSAGLPVRRTGGENKAGKMERDRQKKRPALVERGKMWSHNSYLQ